MWRYLKSTPAIPVAALRNPHFQTPLPVLRVKIDPSWQYTQRFQKVLAVLRENRTALPDGGDWAGKLTPALIPAPRSQERGRSLLCKILVQFPLEVGSGNRPILRQADSQTLCLPQTKVWGISFCGGSLCRGCVLAPAFSEKPTQGQHRPHRGACLCDGERQFFVLNRIRVTIDLRVFQGVDGVDVVPIRSVACVLTNGN